MTESREEGPISRYGSHPQLLSLFCGCGGLDRGFEDAGFRVELALDKNPDAVASYRHNFPKQKARVVDLSTISGKDILELADLQPGMGIIGGPPCQYYSRGNVRPKADDPRRDLPLRYATLVAELNALKGVSFFLFENVRNLASPQHQSALEEIKEVLAPHFWLNESILNAVDFEVPQVRERFFLLGFNKKAYLPDDYEFPKYSVKTRSTVRDFIGGFPPPTFISRTEKNEVNSFHSNHWTMQPRSKKFSEGITLADNAFRRSFRLLSWDRPSWTVAYGNREVHIHPDGQRRLSILEALMLQGFPMTFELKGSFSSQVTQVSNAVPPPLARFLAMSIRAALSRIPATK